MALTDQPYIPIYVDDYLCDEKLNLCDPASEGIFNRIMYVMHKSSEYGKIKITAFDKAKLKQKISKFSANEEQKELIACLNQDVEDFLILTFKIKTLIGRDFHSVIDALIDLIGNDVLQLSENILSQKRMVKDGGLSKTRAKSATKNSKSKKQINSKTKTKPKQNPVNVNGNVDVNENEEKDGGSGEEKSAYEILKESYPTQLETFEMNNRKIIEDWQVFKTNFEYAVERENIIDNPKLMMKRLQKLLANWNKNSTKKEPESEMNTVVQSKLSKYD